MKAILVFSLLAFSAIVPTKQPVQMADDQLHVPIIIDGIQTAELHVPIIIDGVNA